MRCAAVVQRAKLNGAGTMTLGRNWWKCGAERFKLGEGKCGVQMMGLRFAGRTVNAKRGEGWSERRDS